MARTRTDDAPRDIPSWFMTFSDVITLLMTFFILLLTFATNEQEYFERMQISIFGASGSKGIAGKTTTTVDQDSLLMRERPRAGRIAENGSEMPPIFTDPALESFGNGISGLEEDEQRVLSTTHRLTLSTSLLVNSDGEVTSFGAQQLHMLGIQMKKRPLQLDLVVGSNDAVATAITLAQHLMAQEGITLGRVGVGLAPSQVPNDVVRLIMTQQQEQGHGAP
jgi:hypothetical protein